MLDSHRSLLRAGIRRGDRLSARAEPSMAEAQRRILTAAAMQGGQGCGWRCLDRPADVVLVE